MKQYKPFDKPANGCYRAVGIPAEQKLASRSCYFHYSTLATVDSYAKAEFLAELMPPWESKFWIGLERNSYGAFAWPDGEEVRNTFNMWPAGYPKAQGDCVYMTRTDGRLVWHNANCDSDENYACERRPCDTDNYCLVDDE
ncbi:unnamed protein product [Cylicostephanus goldi]|uniref:C-type lectin domain-containing protein n=1 Tax=Cylicostephanus goldi TaxID=71465 RepID=A0A3P6RJX2_CYLGO|nr:unnamed protein product [Cylicostephanus goldi]